MTTQELRENILKELHTLIQHDNAFCESVFEISRVQLVKKPNGNSDLVLASQLAHSNERLDEHHKILTKLTAVLNQLEQQIEKKREEDTQKWAENKKQIMELTSAIQSLERQINPVDEDLTIRPF